MTGDLNNLPAWLAHAQNLHNKNIDMGLERCRAVAQKMNLSLDCPVFTIAGTNGKGSTCAMLESILQCSGFSTGVFTSPHLIDFNERCRVNGEITSDKELCISFENVEKARGDISLTYFEFTTLAILDIFKRANLDAVILEVGLGGRLDAVNIINADCAIITCIDIDHSELLGHTRELIAAEKAGIFRKNAKVIISEPMPPDNLLEIANNLNTDVFLSGRDFIFTGDRQQWNWRGRDKRYAGLAYPALRGANQLLNAAGVLAALEAMQSKLPVTAQAVRNGLAFVQLAGRFQVLAGQPAIVLDVAHNPHAVSALAHNLDAMGFYPVTHAVFGALADKDIAQMMKILNPIVDNWYFAQLDSERAIDVKSLLSLWQNNFIKNNSSGQMYQSVENALSAAIKAAKQEDRIIIFGSFYTVGGALQALKDFRKKNNA